VTARGITAKNVAQKFGFNNASSDINDILSDKSVNTVFVATPHNLHAPYALAALKAGKNVFVEKPLAMNDEELEEIREYYAAHGGNLMVGFNRRFAPVSVELKNLFRNTAEPLVMNYRVNAGFIPKEHWTQHEEIGGGRIIGEVCHFIDLMQYFTDSLPVSVYASCIGAGSEKTINRDNIVIKITFRNGSVGTITYVANGDKLLPKERLEIFGGGHAGIINDFRSGEIYSGNKLKKLKLAGKGHSQEVSAFLEGLKTGRMPISFESIYYTTKATFRIIDSLYTSLPQNID
jgi:polar amino acid transport system substrate-binding protein